ncbi:hypothetical protein AB4114_12165 [Paenibacillus sp. 2RAB27]
MKLFITPAKRLSGEMWDRIIRTLRLWALGEVDGTLSAVDIRLGANSVIATIGAQEEQMSITVPIAPGKTWDFYRNNRVQLPQNLLESV